MTVLAIVKNILFASKITETAKQLNKEATVCGTIDEALYHISRAKIIILDLEEKDAIETVRKLREKFNGDIVGYLSHIRKHELEAIAMIAGCTKVMTRAEITKELSKLMNRA